MSIPGNFSFGAGASSALRFAPSRGRIQGSLANGVNYPSPYFDIAHTYLPATVKQLFRWCRYYCLTNPLINAAIFKCAEYPITDLVVEHPDRRVRERVDEYFHDHLNYRSYQVECGLDYHCYGNSMSSLGFPFKKYLRCTSCGLQERADKIRQYWLFTNNTFRLTCPRCHQVGDAEAKDYFYRNASGIRLIRWNCEHVEVSYNEVTGESTYFYVIPQTVRNDVLIGKKEAVEGIPQVFIQAIRENKGVVFSKDNFFHMKRPTLAQQDRGWGIPMVMPVLKDTFYLQLMKKANEAILAEHIVPLRVVFPQAGSGSSDPYTTVDLTSWREHVAAEIARWRLDNNYIPILPIPIGNQTIGGDGRALLLTPEMQAISDQILAGLGVPREFIYGGLSYSGSNVSMRMLENSFLNYILRQRQQANWVAQMVCSYMGWPRVKIRFKPFKMADDIQRKAYLFQLNQAQKISDTTLLADIDLDQADEDQLMLAETAQRFEAAKGQQVALAKIQAEAQLIMAKAQAKMNETLQAAATAGNAPGEPGGPEGGISPDMTSALSLSQDMTNQLGGGGQTARQGQPGQAGMSIVDLAQSLAQQLLAMPPEYHEQVIQNLQSQNPELAQLVVQFAREMQKSQPAGVAGLGAAGEAATQVNMTPLPNKLPPRRAAATV